MGNANFRVYTGGEWLSRALKEGRVGVGLGGQLNHPGEDDGCESSFRVQEMSFVPLAARQQKEVEMGFPDVLKVGEVFLCLLSAIKSNKMGIKALAVVVSPSPFARVAIHLLLPHGSAVGFMYEPGKVVMPCEGPAEEFDVVVLHGVSLGDPRGMRPSPRDSKRAVDYLYDHGVVCSSCHDKMVDWGEVEKTCPGCFQQFVEKDMAGRVKSGFYQRETDVSRIIPGICDEAILEKVEIKSVAGREVDMSRNAPDIEESSYEQRVEDCRIRNRILEGHDRVPVRLKAAIDLLLGLDRAYKEKFDSEELARSFGDLRLWVESRLGKTLEELRKEMA